MELNNTTVFSLSLEYRKLFVGTGARNYICNEFFPTPFVPFLAGYEIQDVYSYVLFRFYVCIVCI